MRMLDKKQNFKNGISTLENLISDFYIIENFNSNGKSKCAYSIKNSIEKNGIRTSENLIHDLFIIENFNSNGETKCACSIKNSIKKSESEPPKT